MDRGSNSDYYFELLFCYYFELPSEVDNDHQHLIQEQYIREKSPEAIKIIINKKLICGTVYGLSPHSKYKYKSTEGTKYVLTVIPTIK